MFCLPLDIYQCLFVIVDQCTSVFVALHCISVLDAQFISVNVDQCISMFVDQYRWVCLCESRLCVTCCIVKKLWLDNVSVSPPPYFTEMYLFFYYYGCDNIVTYVVVRKMEIKLLDLSHMSLVVLETVKVIAHFVLPPQTKFLISTYFLNSKQMNRYWWMFSLL